MKTSIKLLAACMLLSGSAFGPVNLAKAERPQCLRDADAYADGRTGGNRNNPDWETYHNEYADEHCTGSDPLGPGDNPTTPNPCSGQPTTICS